VSVNEAEEKKSKKKKLMVEEGLKCVERGLMLE